MAQYSVRRIPLRPRPHISEKWDAGWLDPFLDTAMRLADITTLRFARIGGLAAMLGGTLWIVLFILLQIERLWIDYGIFQVVYLIDTRWLSLPLLLFLACLVSTGGLYIQHARRASWLGVIGFLLAIVGLTWTLLDTYKYSRGENRGFINLFYIWPTLSWYGMVCFQLLLMSVGLVLLGVSMLRSGVLPTRTVKLFVGSALAIHLALVLSRLEELGIVTALFILFGASWMVLGFALITNRKTRPA